MRTTGDEETWGTDGASAGERVKQREVRMALGTLGHGRIDRLDGVQGDAAWADEGLDQEGMGSADARSGGQGSGARDGVEALSDAIGVAHVLGVEAALQGRASCQVGRREGRPWGEAVAEDGGALLVQPWQDMREGVLQGPGAPMGHTPCVPDHAAAMCDELGEGAHGRTLGLQRRALLAMRAQERTLERGVCGVVLGLAGGEGRALLRQGEGMDGKAPEAGILAQRRDEGALVACEAEGNRWSVAPLAPGARPRVDGVWRVCKDAAFAFLSARCLQAEIVCGIGPVEADEGRTLLRRETRHVSPPVG